MGVSSIATMFTAANAGMSAYQSYQAAEQSRAEAKLAADSLETQAARKELEAEETRKIGLLNQADTVREGRLERAERRASYGASGVKVDEGSAAAVAADGAAWTEYKRQKVEYESNLESWGLKYDAALLRQEAANTRASGKTGNNLQSAIGAGTKFLGAIKSL